MDNVQRLSWLFIYETVKLKKLTYFFFVFQMFCMFNTRRFYFLVNERCLVFPERDDLMYRPIECVLQTLGFTLRLNKIAQ